MKTHNQQRYLVVGDAFIDVWMTADCKRMSAEQPGLPIFDVFSRREQPGGAGNVAKAVSRLVGDPQVRQWVPMLPERPVKNRILVEGRQVCRFDLHDKCPPLSKIPVDWLDGSVIILSDYNKGAVTDGLIKQIAESRAKSIWVNAKTIQPRHWGLAVDRPGNGPTARWTCNQAEYEADKAFYQAQPEVYVTSPSGITHCQTDKASRTSSKATDVVSVCGAGDVVLAALASAPENVRPMEWAMAAAGVAVGRPFTYCPTLSEVYERYAE